MADLKAQHICKKILLYTGKNVIGTLKMFTIAYGLQTRGGSTSHIQKWCDLP